MNAGMGMIHSERPPSDIHEIGGVQELIQLWVNTPAKHKMDQPSYQPLTADETPEIISEDGLTQIKIIAGELDGVKGPIHTLSDVNTFTVKMKKGASYYFAIPITHNAFIYLMEGKLAIGNEDELDAKYVASFQLDGDGITIEALEDAHLFIGTGEPLNEPLVSHGPFVMNTQTEIMEAIRDYQLGKMGVLIEE
jgi:redox-sensitive bicupin YhaK (pirin superfamily)